MRARKHKAVTRVMGLERIVRCNSCSEIIPYSDIRDVVCYDCGNNHFACQLCFDNVHSMLNALGLSNTKDSLKTEARHRHVAEVLGYISIDECKQFCHICKQGEK